MLEYLRLDDVTADHRKRRGRLLRRGLYHHALRADQRSVLRDRVENPVALGVRSRHVHDGDQVAADFLSRLHHLLEAGRASQDQIIREQHRERLVSHEIARAPDGMAKAERTLLARVGELAWLRHPAVDRDDLRRLAALAQRRLELVGMIEMVLERGFAAPGHENELLDARRLRLFHRILDQRLVHHRQHFLRHRLGRRQEARAETGDGKYSLADGSAHGARAFSRCSVPRGDNGAPHPIVPASAMLPKFASELRKLNRTRFNNSWPASP